MATYWMPTRTSDMQLQLNRGERRHQLARRPFFANQGAFRTGDYEEIMNKATCLSLLSNAVLMWNTVHMTRIITQLRATGETIADEDVARVSPAAFAHVIPNGTYFVRPTPLEREENREEALGLPEEDMESDV
jgi:Tn3 transposase DDE domain